MARPGQPAPCETRRPVARHCNAGARTRATGPARARPAATGLRNLQSTKTFLTLELLVGRYRKSGRKSYLKRAGRGPQRLLPTRERPVFVLTRPSCAGPGARSSAAAPRSQPLIFQPKSSIAIRNSFDCQIMGRVSNLDSNLNSTA